MNKEEYFNEINFRKLELKDLTRICRHTGMEMANDEVYTQVVCLDKLCRDLTSLNSKLDEPAMNYNNVDLLSVIEQEKLNANDELDKLLQGFQANLHAYMAQNTEEIGEFEQIRKNISNKLTHYEKSLNPIKFIRDSILYDSCDRALRKDAIERCVASIDSSRCGEDIEIALKNLSYGIFFNIERKQKCFLKGLDHKLHSIESYISEYNQTEEWGEFSKLRENIVSRLLAHKVCKLNPEINKYKELAPTRNQEFEDPRLIIINKSINHTKNASSVDEIKVALKELTDSYSGNHIGWGKKSGMDKLINNFELNLEKFSISSIAG